MRPLTFVPSGGLRLLVSLLALFALSDMKVMPQVAADDYTVTITKVQLTSWCEQYGCPLLFSFLYYLFVRVVRVCVCVCGGGSALWRV